jgi:transposase
VARIVVSNPLITKAIAKAKVKTDKVDARVLSHLLRLDYLPAVWQPDTSISQLREWTARRARIVRQSTAVVNRIRGTLAQRLLDCPHQIRSARARTWIAAQTVDDATRWLLESDLRILDCLRVEKEALETQLAKHGYADPRVKLLMTLPGISQHSALSLLAAIGDISRFPSADALASYLGLVPSTRQSAEHCYHGPITKQGRSQTRWMLIQSAQTVGRHPGPLGYFFRRLKKRKPHNVAVVAVAHKLALLAWHLLTTGEPYRYALPRTTEIKLRDLRMQATGKARKHGPASGSKPRTRAPKGSRLIKPLAEVYQNEGVPVGSPAPAGERRHLAESKLEAFAESLQQEQIVVRRPPQELATDQSP